MKLETFFENFDRFADAPDAVAKMPKFSPNGAIELCPVGAGRAAECL